MREKKRLSRNQSQTNISNNTKHLDLKNFYHRLKKTPMFSAFNRQNLGSIPSKIDTFIFNLEKDSINNENFKLNEQFKSENDLFINDIFEKEHRTFRDFGTGNSIEIKGNIVKFSVNNDLKNISKQSDYDKKNIDSFKSFYSYSLISNKSSNITNKYDINSTSITINNSKNKNIINKNRIIFRNNSDSKMKFPKEDRNLNILYRNKILNKYYPGPGDYEVLSSNENKNNYRYDSLFKGKSSFSLNEIKTPTAELGPGSYDILKDAKIPGGFFSKLKKYDNFNSPFNISDKDINTSPRYKLPSSFNIKNIWKKNYFFMINSPRKEKLEIKLGLNRNDKVINNNINEYQKKDNSNWEKGRSINTSWIKTKLENKIREKIKEGKILEKINDKKKNYEYELNQNENNNNKSNNDDKNKVKVKNIGKVYSFNKIPRFYELMGKHVPGPSYYDPEKILQGIKQKKCFNVKENGWI